jgi:hypothetical protein
LWAEIAIVESCLPREKKLKWIPPNVTMKPASDTQGSPMSQRLLKLLGFNGLVNDRLILPSILDLFNSHNFSFERAKAMPLYL